MYVLNRKITTELMKKKKYQIPVTTVLPLRAVPLMVGSPLPEAETETFGGISNEEIDGGLSRSSGWNNIWDD